MSEALINRLVEFAESGNQQKNCIEWSNLPGLGDGNYRGSASDQYRLC